MAAAPDVPICPALLLPFVASKVPTSFLRSAIWTGQGAGGRLIANKNAVSHLTHRVLAWKRRRCTRVAERGPAPWCVRSAASAAVSAPPPPLPGAAWPLNARPDCTHGTLQLTLVLALAGCLVPDGRGRRPGRPGWQAAAAVHERTVGPINLTQLRWVHTTSPGPMVCLP